MNLQLPKLFGAAESSRKDKLRLMLKVTILSKYCLFCFYCSTNAGGSFVSLFQRFAVCLFPVWFTLYRKLIVLDGGGSLKTHWYNSEQWRRIGMDPTNTTQQPSSMSNRIASQSPRLFLIKVKGVEHRPLDSISFDKKLTFFLLTQ